MIWFKAWREARLRLAMGLFMVFSFFVLSQLFETPQAALERSAETPGEVARLCFLTGNVDLPQPGAPDFQSRLRWRLYLQLAVFVSPMIGVMMAGSGVYSQMLNGLRESVHPSMSYTLSLPVPRRRWLEVRAGLGLLLTAGLIATILAIPPLAGMLRNQPVPWTWALKAAPFLFLGTLVFYMLAVLLVAALDEHWQAGAAAVALTCLAAQFSLGNRINIFPFMAGYQTSVAGVLLCLALSGTLYGGAMVALDRRDF